LFYILSGEDDFSIAGELVNIRKSIGDSGMLDTNTNILDGKQVTADELRAVCESAPFLSEKRLVIIHGCWKDLPLRSPPAAPGTTKKSDSQPAGHEAFSDSIYQTAGKYHPGADLKTNSRRPTPTEIDFV